MDTRTWYQIHRYSSNQITGGDADQYTLCSDCFSKYTQLITSSDKAFAEWMSNKPTVTPPSHEEDKHETDTNPEIDNDEPTAISNNER